MAHIECYKNHGIDYLRICEARYIKELKKQKKFTLKNIGPLSKYDDGKPDFLKRLRNDFKEGKISFDGITYESRTKTNNVFELDDTHQINLKNIGYFFLESVYEQLGIDKVLFQKKTRSKIEYDLNGITKLLVFDRILHPSSKYKAFQEREKFYDTLVKNGNLDSVFDALTVLNEKKNAIELRMNTSIKNSETGRNTDLLFYDVTNYYFETMYGDDDIYELDDDNKIVLSEDGIPKVIKKGFKKKGVSKENSDGPIVQMGLLIDSNGLPAGHKLYPGNTQDKTTCEDLILTELDNKEYGKIVLVADNGMNTQGNKYLLVDKGNGYIVSKSIKKSWKSMKDFALDEEGYTCMKNQSNEVVFKYKSRINEITVKDKNGNKKQIKEKEIVYWSKKHYEKEKHQNSKFIEYLESCKEHPDKLKDKQRKSQEFIKVVQVDKKTGEIIKTKQLVVLLEDKIKKYQDTMGYYSIVTSEIESSDIDIINKYHGLSRIEDSFRIIKSDLEGRPVHVWTEEHIKAHFLICFIALTIVRIIQLKILKYENKDTLNINGWEQGITAERLKQALNSMEIASDKNGTCIIRQYEDEINKILKSIDIKSIDLTSVDKVNQFKNQVKKAKFI